MVVIVLLGPKRSAESTGTAEASVTCYFSRVFRLILAPSIENTGAVADVFCIYGRKGWQKGDFLWSA